MEDSTCNLLCCYQVRSLVFSELSKRGLGVRNEVFLKSFEKFLEDLAQLTKSDVVATKYLIMKNEIHLAHSIVKDQRYNFHCF